MKRKLNFLALVLFVQNGICQTAPIRVSLSDSIAVVCEMDSLIELNVKFISQGLLEDALQVVEAAEGKISSSIGKDNSSYAYCLFRHGSTLWLMKQHSKAKSLLMEAKVLQEKTIGKDNPVYANILNNLGLLYIDLSSYQDAEVLLLEAKNIREIYFGGGHKLYRASLQNLAFLYVEMEKYEKAEVFFLQTNQLFELSNDKLTLDYAANLNNMGNMYKDMGRVFEAEKVYLECLSILERMGEKDNEDYLMAYHNLGNLNHSMGRFEKSESYLLYVKEVREKINNGVTPGLANVLSRIGTLKADLGQINEAESYFLLALKITEKIYGKSNPRYVGVLTNLAILYEKSKQYELAENYLLECRKVIESKLGNKSRQFANNSANLGTLYLKMNRFEDASVFLRQAVFADSVVGRGKENLAYIFSLGNLGLVEAKMEHHAAAESMFLESLSLHEKVIGSSNFKHAKLMQNLASFYWKLNRITDAQKYDLQADVNERFNLANASHHLSEKELETYSMTFLTKFEEFLSFAQQNIDSTLASACLDDILFYKGFLLTTLQQIRQSFYSDSVAKLKVTLLNSYYERLARELSKSITKRDTMNVVFLKERANVLEKELARKLSALRLTKEQLSWRQIQLCLHPNEVSIEFVSYNYHNRGRTDSTIYAAIVLTKISPYPLFIPLFEEKSLDSLLHSKSERRADYVNSLYALADRGVVPVQAPKKSLYEILWKPLEKELTGIKTIYFSPSGLLHRINLDAIPVSETETLADRYNLIELNSTRQLVIPTQIKNINNDAVLFGGIQYEQDSALQNTEPMIVSRSRGELSFNHIDSTLRGGSWNYLAGTEREVNSIEKLMLTAGLKVNLKKGYQATEATFKNIGANSAPSPKILHIATHGYFFPDPKVQSKSSGWSGQNEPAFKMSDHPMLRSGLIMAGGNAAWQGKQTQEGREDGVLTAYEISQMNLSNTELVVLSACETGLGDIQGNEGIYGLQRAFKIAGAKYLIMSLWQVPDKQTSLLMTAFYKKWLVDKMTLPDAFHAAQKELRDNGLDPYNWAGFVLVE